MIAYRNAARRGRRATALRARARARRLDALTFASPSAVRRFVRAARRARARGAARAHVVAAIGPVTARALAAAGLPRAGGRASSATAAGLVEELGRSRSAERATGAEGRADALQGRRDELVTDEELERIFNEWTAQGWQLRRRALRDERASSGPRWRSSRSRATTERARTD